MKRKFAATLAVLMAAILALGITVLALDYDVPEGATEVTSLFTVLEEGDGFEFTIVSQELDIVINVTADTVVYFEDYVPLGDDDEGETRNAREVLFGRTLAEVLENRNMRVIFIEDEDNVAVSIMILFETAVHLPADVGDYVGITTLPGEVEWDEEDDVYDFNLNGEIVVNGEILEGAPLPFVNPDHSNIAMVPLRAVAQALGYDVSWNRELQSVQMGVAIHVWIGRAEAYFGRMAPIALGAEPVNVDGVVFVPHDFFRNVLGRVVYIFEGQIVIADESDMY